MPNWRALQRLFVMSAGVNLTYRFDIFIWTLAEAAVPLVTLGIWYTVSRQGVLSISPQETITYFIFIMFARSATNTWVGFFLSREILSGELARFLVRPLSVFWEHMADNLTVKVFRLGIPALILLVLLVIRPVWLAPAVYEPVHLVLFVVSLLLGMILAFTFDAIFALFAFWLEDANQILRFQHMLWQIATGILIPYAVMPPFLFLTLRWLPFRYMVSVPVELLLGQIPAHAAPAFMGGQIGWIAISATLVWWLWQRGLQRYAVPGQ